ncbi:uncharacterized protein LOC111829527 [Capsella rubella]|uniref:uncharacterized protein LOC111829527 n=1 Tax=Capsella rubella TaxID=81985 RepID=UPI000CD54D4C|nr:uncharacterized protein LOC111829527 [Capsella rubella]
MTTSMVSSMLLFLILLLVFPHINNALGAPMDLQAFKRNLPDQVAGKFPRVTSGVEDASQQAINAVQSIPDVKDLADDARDAAQNSLAQHNAAQDKSSNGFWFWCSVLVISLFFKL